ncbi:hypothetical protein E0198_000051 [Clavispora lusitaniae]|nr:hypothetical protein E0198_000051 [Clavispora lusitaniae]
MNVPLLLKVRSGQNAVFSKCSSNTISFNNKQYEFSAIYEDEIPDNALQKLTSTSSALVLIGPTGSGKTTTLRSILEHKVNSPNDILFTACEVKENRMLNDLLDNGSKKKYLSSIPIETQLKKQTLNPSTIQKVFEDRETAATDANSASSRSCLIVSLHEDSHTTTIVDMMGNEKFHSTTNSFANTNISSITQLLLSKTTIRSSNLVTNIIFNRPQQTEVKFLLHLHQDGCPKLIKSALLNIADVLKVFRMSPAKKSLKCETDKTRNVPNYAMPTVSSLSPVKQAFKVSKPLKPSRIDVKIRPHAKDVYALTPLNLNSNSTFNTRTVKQIKNKGITQSLYEVEIKRLESSNLELEMKRNQLLNELVDYRRKMHDSVGELKSEMSFIKNEKVHHLKEILLAVKMQAEKLVSENNSLKDELARTNEMLELSQITSSKQLKNLETELSSKDVILQELTSSYTSKMESLESEIFNLKQTLIENQEIICAKDTSINSLQTEVIENGRKLKEIETAKKESDNVLEELQDERGSFVKKIAGLETKISHLQDTLVEKSSIISGHNSHVQSIEGLLAKTREAKGELRKQSKKLSQQLDEMMHENKDLAKKHSDLMSYNKYIVQKYSGALQENENLKEQYEQAAAKIREENRELRELQDSYGILREQLCRSKKELVWKNVLRNSKCFLCLNQTK